jgi:ATP-dependent Clp protease ATP-binding subunit ClpC
MQLANQEAVRLGHEFVTSLHVLYGIVKEGSGLGANVLRNLDAFGRVAAQLEEELRKLPRMNKEPDSFKLQQMEDTKNAIARAIEAARGMGHSYVGSEHLLLGLLHKRGAACRVLSEANVTFDAAKEEILTVLGEKARTEVVEARSKIWFTLLVTIKEGDVRDFHVRGAADSLADVQNRVEDFLAAVRAAEKEPRVQGE